MWDLQGLRILPTIVMPLLLEWSLNFGFMSLPNEWLCRPAHSVDALVKSDGRDVEWNGRGEKTGRLVLNAC
jgi:hypothetical protein